MKISIAIDTRSFILSAAIAWTIGNTAYAYNLPPAKPIAPNNQKITWLLRMSEGVEELAGRAKKAVVFVSVAKTTSDKSPNEIDPFEFFFGPNYSPSHSANTPKVEQRGLGSGFMVDLTQGFIITNNHVVEGADEITVKLANGHTYQAKVLGRDPNTDVAVVRIKPPNFNRAGVSALSLGDSSHTALHEGAFVMALGAPFGLETSLSFGILSARGRGNLNITVLGNFLQTDAAINPGNSGGPLLNTKGEVIGMNTAIYSRSGSSAGIGFAVPSNILRRVADQIITKGRVDRGYLGVRLLQEPESRDSDQNSGATIDSVTAHSPAASAGLKKGDTIIALNGQAIKSASELTNTVGLMPPGYRVKVLFKRQKSRLGTTVTIGPYPKIEALSGTPKADQKLVAGLFAQNPKTELKDFASIKSQFGLKRDEGLVITYIKPGSKADQAGLLVGDLILRVNRKKVKDIDDVAATYKRDGRLVIQLEREGQLMFSSISS